MLLPRYEVMGQNGQASATGWLLGLEKEWRGLQEEGVLPGLGHGELPGC